MITLTHRVVPFVEWAFGPEFAARLAGRMAAPEPGPEERPSARFGYTPRASEDAFWAGYCLGLDREDADAPAHYTPTEARNFLAGWSAGFREWERRLDIMFADHVADGHITDLDVHPRGVC